MTLEVVAFFAHPDDETMLCGGTLALLAAQGARVHVVIATRGEGGEMGEPPLAIREELGNVRDRELRCAVEALNAASLTILDYVDPTIGPNDTLFPFTEDEQTLTGQLVDILRLHNAGALITHGVNGEYGHPAHVLVYRAAMAAVQALKGNAPLWYTVQGSYEGNPHPMLANKDAPAHILIDVTPVLAQKTQAALCHRTQHALFVRRASEEAGRALTVEEVIQPVESLHRAYPSFKGIGRMDDALASLLWASGSASLPGQGLPQDASRTDDGPTPPIL